MQFGGAAAAAFVGVASVVGEGVLVSYNGDANLDLDNVGNAELNGVIVRVRSTGTGTNAIIVSGDSDGAYIGFLGADVAGQQEITGSLSTVIDPAAKDVLTSLLALLVTFGLGQDETT